MLRQRPTAVLAVVLLSTVVFPLTITGSSAALPDIATSLSAGPGATRWVVTGYNAAFAAFLVFTGSLADVLGRRRCHLAGVALFAAAGLACALATDVVVLDVLRFAAGIGAAAAVTGGGSILAETFSGAARARAFGLLGTVLGAGLAFGPTIGGLLVDHLGWRAVFAVPAALAALVLVCAPLLPVLPGNPHRRVDWAGAALSTAALLVVITAVSEAAYWWLLLVPLLGAAFARVERHRPDPLFDLGLLRNRRFTALSAAAGSFMAVLVPLLVYLPSYLISVVGMGAGEAGLWLLLLTLPTVVLPPLGALLVRAVPVPVVVVGSLLGTGAGALLLVTATPRPGPWMGAFVLVGAGVGLTTGLLDGLALGAVPGEQAGAASGMFNAARLGTETVALAAVGPLLAALGGGSLIGTDGLQVVGTLLGCFAAVAAGVVGWTWHNGRSNTGFGSPRDGDPTTT
ncbi:MFS transporter [Actinokineospora spheciospongiae]|uniref:MFS transporter n=1 Tax=Actinokineospora spheciospongiae TaxID=909613 RepID=UPI000D71888A|nr:MFS transporter [Actinokineospora spheciospongiae]PWW62741.1 putative MFS family arabinose efflux permease [Actinokineospora spheciospongiae]